MIHQKNKKTVNDVNDTKIMFYKYVQYVFITKRRDMQGGIFVQKPCYARIFLRCG